MMELQFKHLVGYLPHGLKVQYEGIVNGKQLKEYDDKFKKEYGINYSLNPNYSPPEEIKSLKIGYIKEVGLYLKYTKYKIGRKGLQTHYGTAMFKPVLHPLSEYYTDTITKDVMDKLGCKILVVHELWDLYSGKKTVSGISLETYNVICKNHIDMYGLIDAGLAVDINTLDLIQK